MFQRILPSNAPKELSRPEPAHFPAMRAILDQGLLSPLSSPLKVSLTEGVRVESLAQAHALITKHLHPFKTPEEAKPCEDVIRSVMRETDGDFLLSLPIEDCGGTAIPPHNPSIEMRPLGALGWKLVVGDGVEQPEILRSVGAQSLKVGERLAFALCPIPGMKGASGFSTHAATQALRSSPLLGNTPQDAEGTSSLDTIISARHGRFKISCTLGFWVEGDILHRDGHYAFAPQLYARLPEHQAQLRVDIIPLSDKNTQLEYVDSAPVGTQEILENVTKIMKDSFSLRSPHRKTKSSDFVEL
jgi:hypothetical protein